MESWKRRLRISIHRLGYPETVLVSIVFAATYVMVFVLLCTLSMLLCQRTSGFVRAFTFLLKTAGCWCHTGANIIKLTSKMF